MDARQWEGSDKAAAIRKRGVSHGTAIVLTADVLLAQYLRLRLLGSYDTMGAEALTDEKEAQKPSMKPFPWLQERLAHDALDHTVTLAYIQYGSWMGLRVLECFQLTGAGSFSWEWEDAYARVPYQSHTSVLDAPTTAALFHLFQAGLPSLLRFQDGQPLPALLPDALAASFSIHVAEQQAHYFYPLNTRHRSTTRSTGGEAPAHGVAPQLQQLLDQFVRLRKAARDERPLP